MKKASEHAPKIPEDLDFWWLLPNQLAGMARPMGNELPALHHAGIRAVISLLEEPMKPHFYTSRGFRNLYLELIDDFPPTLEQLNVGFAFMEEAFARQEAVAVHCIAGWGRTGTFLASYLISQGASTTEAIERVRVAQPHAIRSGAQLQFLHTLSPKHFL